MHCAHLTYGVFSLRTCCTGLARTWKVFGTGTVSSVTEAINKRPARHSLDQCGRRRIAKQGAHTLVCRMNIFAVGVCSDQQYIFGLPGFDQAFSQAQAINKTRAALVEIKGSTVSRQPQAILENTGCGR